MIIFYLNRQIGVRKMAYAQSLRVIGQSLDAARLVSFELENDGKSYLMRSDSLTQTSEWILRDAVREGESTVAMSQSSTVNRSLVFTQAVVSRLDAQGQKRRNSSLPRGEASKGISQLLRTLGDHLDSAQARAFRISWSPLSVSVEYQRVNGAEDSRTFSVEKLQELSSRTKFRWSNQTRLTANSPEPTPYIPAGEYLKHTRQRDR
jgi:hypothetical protein